MVRSVAVVAASLLGVEPMGLVGAWSTPRTTVSTAGSSTSPGGFLPGTVYASPWSRRRRLDPSPRRCSVWNSKITTTTLRVMDEQRGVTTSSASASSTVPNDRVPPIHSPWKRTAISMDDPLDEIISLDDDSLLLAHPVTTTTRTIPSWFWDPSFSSLRGCSIVWTEETRITTPTTGPTMHTPTAPATTASSTTYVLVGCYHGSATSAADVQSVLERVQHHQQFNNVLSATRMKQQQQNQGDVSIDSSSNRQHGSSKTVIVALELCAQRYLDFFRNPQNQGSVDDAMDENSDISANSKTANPAQPPPPPETSLPWIVRYGNMVSSTVQRRGWSVGMVTALLGLANGIQTQVLQLKPGWEFQTAVDHCQKYQLDVVLVDQSVEQTLHRLARIFPDIAGTLWLDFFRTRSYAQTFGREASALQTALWGIPPTRAAARSEPRSTFNNSNPTGTYETHGVLNNRPPATRMALSTSEAATSTTPKISNAIDNGGTSVNLLSFLTRSTASVMELLRLIVVPMAILSIVYFGIAVVWASAWELAISTPTEIASSWWLFSAASPAELPDIRGGILAAVSPFHAETEGGSNLVSTAMTTTTTAMLWNNSILFMLLLYHSLVLPATQVVLRERDEHLADGIRTACQQYSQQPISNNNDANKNSFVDTSQQQDEELVVVAVLGFLHVNGVAQRLLQNSGQRASETK